VNENNLKTNLSGTLEYTYQPVDAKSDIAHIKETFSALPGSNNLIVTTEKDAMRLHGLDGLPIRILPITVAFHKENDKDFDTLIEASVRENISFLSKLSIWS
jgi:hypothetical protein